MLNSRYNYAAALLLVFLSGAAALAHQLSWIRLFADVLGIGSGTFARVTGAFFLGLSLGAWIASIWKPLRPLRAIAIAELGVAALALLILQLPGLPLGSALSPLALKFFEWLAPLLLVGTAAIGMGVTLPWILRAVPCDGTRATWLYAINTLGAAVGITLLLIISFSGVGLRPAILAAISANILLAFCFFLLSRSSIPETKTEKSTQSAEEGRSLYLWAFGSGFLILGQEVIWQHQFAQVTINSFASSAVVLFFVLLVLGTVALLAPLFQQSLARHVSGLGFLAALAALACLIQPLFFFQQTGNLQFLPYQLPFGPYLAEVGKLGLVAILPAALTAGLIFPFLIKTAAGNPQLTGRLLAWNGLGGLAGAEITSFFIAPAFGIWTTMSALGCGYLALAAWRGQKAITLGVVLVAPILIWQTNKLPQAGIAQAEKLVAVQTGTEGVVGVVQKGPRDWRILFNNTYTLGGSKAQYNQERQAHLPLLLHPDPSAVATLGVATGSTLAGVALHSNVQDIDGFELSPIAANFAKKYFESFNRSVFADSRVRIIQGDARWELIRHRKKYNVIIGDLFLPWRTGEGRLYSLEHFQNVRKSLKPGGLFCQWLPLFQLTQDQFLTICRTFAAVFPDYFLIRGDFYSDIPIVGLVGGRSLEQIDWEAMAESCLRLETDNQTRDALVLTPSGVAMMILGTPGELPEGPINTLANGWIEWNAGANIFGLREPWFTKKPFQEFMEKVHHHTIFPSAGSELKHAWSAGYQAGQTKPGQKITPLLPSVLKDKTKADWSQWPGKPQPFLEK